MRGYFLNFSILYSQNRLLATAGVSNDAKIQNKQVQELATACAKPCAGNLVPDEEKKADEKLVKEATEKEWADVDAEQKVSWMQFHELLPRLIVENEKIKAAELDYEAAVEALKSEYTAYYPQVTVSIGNNWEDDRTPAKGTFPNNTITHDSKQGIQKSITMEAKIVQNLSGSDLKCDHVLIIF